jgi:GH25 family lysozyme M1 (1,4-beta-N-acetylmuramidase)
VIRGIDISSWQERVDFARVVADGIGFVYVKATDGVGYVNPWYRAQIAGASDAGLPCGSYHFAQPGSHSGDTVASARRDARSEAEYFLSIAFPKKGQLVPVLDLEVGGLPPHLYVEWVRAWLDHVAEKTGVPPILYTNPNTWTKTGNSTAFGRYPLWIAHYGVDAPAIPAGWSSYTIWQFTETGVVDGVAGRVDVNRLADGATIDRITYGGEQPGPAQNLPGPVPKPEWYWSWQRWRFGVGEFLGLPQDPAVRPDEAPADIPDWAWACEKKLIERRKGGKVPLALLRPGQTHEAVLRLKPALAAQLRALGHAEMADAIKLHSKNYGPSDVLAVQQFQRDKGLDDDGVVGPLTWRALGFDEDVAPVPRPVLNGVPYEPGVVALDGRWVAKPLAEELLAQRRAGNWRGTAYSAFRPDWYQAKLWKAALKKYGSPEEARKWVAPPGRSRHRFKDWRGAVDVTPKESGAPLDAASSWLYRRLANEPWHMEAVGPRGFAPDEEPELTEGEELQVVDEPSEDEFAEHGITMADVDETIESWFELVDEGAAEDERRRELFDPEASGPSG